MGSEFPCTFPDQLPLSCCCGSALLSGCSGVSEKADSLSTRGWQLSEKAALFDNVNGRAEYGGEGNGILSWLTLCWYVVACCLDSASVHMCSTIALLSGEVAGIYIRKPGGLHGITLFES